MKKHLLTSSFNKEGITRLRNNAFTLIELLAIIVILAIIAVITVPIILNIIENSRKGAATDSAFGYKDAVNKYYVTELSKPENQNLVLNGEYTVLADGVLDGNGIDRIQIPVSGDKPSSGYLKYENNALKEGCLVIGEYAVRFDGNGKSSVTANDGCSAVLPSMDEMCPDCVYKFIAYSNQSIYFHIGDSLNESEYVEDYTDLGQSVFFGLVLDGDGKINRTFSCGIEKNTPFCIEGYSSDPTGSIDQMNKKILSIIYGNTFDEETGTGCSLDDIMIMCTGTDGGANYYFDSTSGGVDTWNYDWNFMVADSDGTIYNNAG